MLESNQEYKKVLFNSNFYTDLTFADISDTLCESESDVHIKLIDFKSDMHAYQIQ